VDYEYVVVRRLCPVVQVTYAVFAVGGDAFHFPLLELARLTHRLLGVRFYQSKTLFVAVIEFVLDAIT